MTARILLQNNGSSGGTHWIEKPVIRVGSDPSSDVVIPNAAVAPHALTVEFRQTGYRIYNRSSTQVFLGSRVLDPGQFASWLDTDLLELPDGVSLALETDEDPAPAARPQRIAGQPLPVQGFHEAPVIIDQDTDGHLAPPTVNQLERRAALDESNRAAGHASDSQTSGGNTGLQLVVIGLCLLGSGGLIARHQIMRPLATGTKAPSFAQVVEQVRQPGGEIQAEFLDKLQLAEAALIRGQRALAHRRYQQLYDQLVFHDTTDERITHESAQQQLPSPLVQLALLVRQRLEQFQR